MVKVAVNGFGRIGRLVTRAAFGTDNIEIVLINDPQGGAAAAAHLLEYDSTNGKWMEGKISVDGNTITVDGKKITFTEKRVLSEIPLKELGVEMVLECSGKFLTKDALAPYFTACGVKKVVVSAPCKFEGMLDCVYGVNSHLYDPKKFDIVSAASCTTNCLAPVVKAIHETLKIVHGSMTTIHCVTNTQVIADAPHKDLRRARSCLLSLIPTTTGSATAIGVIFPELKGKLNGQAIRVPMLGTSSLDCCFEVSRKTTVEEVNSIFKQYSEGPLKGILGYETKPLVSEDFKNDARSGIVDALSTMVIDGTQVKILAWYDNEWGYSCRMADVARMVAKSIA
eukprot:tig00000615_g2564.t1